MQNPIQTPALPQIFKCDSPDSGPAADDPCPEPEHGRLAGHRSVSDRHHEVVDPGTGMKLQVVAAPVQQDPYKHPCSPLVGIDEPGIAHHAVQKRCSLSRDGAMIPGVRPSKSRLDHVQAVDAGSAAEFQSLRVDIKGICQGQAIVHLSLGQSGKRVPVKPGGQLPGGNGLFA
jgi:hypothetical protein